VDVIAKITLGVGFRNLVVSRFCPGEICWIDIRQEPFLETVMLVRTHEMNLTAKNRIIIHYIQIVTQRRLIAGEGGSVIVNANLRGVLSGQQAGPGGGA
jgi:hypothetical protein